MEEIASFEERLSSLKQRGEDLVASCTDQVQAKISQQVQAHRQGTGDSYSAICSTAQRVSQQSLPKRSFISSFLSAFDHFQKKGTVLYHIMTTRILSHLFSKVYQSLDRELQKHVSHQDTLQQCQTWLTTVREELKLNDQGPSGLQEALKQVTNTSLVCLLFAVIILKSFVILLCSFTFAHTGETLQGPPGAGQHIPGPGVFSV